MNNGVTPTNAAVRKAATEADFFERFRSLCDPSVTGVSLTELAERFLGMPRAKLYESFDIGSGRHPRLSWLELLPAAAQLRYLRERAQALGFQLAPIATEHAGLAQVAMSTSAAIAAIASSEADGHVSRAEAAENIKAIEALQEVLSKSLALQREALRTGGVRLAGGRK